MKPPFRLVPDDISNDTVEALMKLSIAILGVIAFVLFWNWHHAENRAKTLEAEIQEACDTARETGFISHERLASACLNH